jgi:hypothetical protein
MSFSIEVSCKKHPRYTAKLKPRANCMECKSMYQIRGHVSEITSNGARRLYGVSVQPNLIKAVK